MKKKLLALFLALAMLLSLAACGNNSDPADNGKEPAQDQQGGDTQEPVDVTDSEFYGPIYDEWSEKTDDELYQMALEEVKENPEINIYATSSKMLKVEEKFEETYPGLDLVIMDLDQDEVLEKCVLESDSGNILGDVLQAKDVNGDVFFDYYEEGYCTAFYPKDISALIDEDLLRYGYPLYASQSFWYYNDEAFPDGQPVTNWWQIIEKNEDGSQKYRLFTKEIGTETAYLSLFASFVVNADQMEQAYEDIYGEDADLARIRFLDSALYTVFSGCLFDEFQRVVYADPTLTPEQISQTFVTIARSYGLRSFGKEFSHYWMQVNHNFESPFYYISYAVSMLASLQIYEMAENDWAAAAGFYNDLVSLGAFDYTYCELLDKVGLECFTDGLPACVPQAVEDMEALCLAWENAA